MIKRQKKVNSRNVKKVGKRTMKWSRGRQISDGLKRKDGKEKWEVIKQGQGSTQKKKEVVL